MANFKFLIGASLLVVAFGSHAGYANVVPPAALSQVPPTVSTGSASLSWLNNAVKFNASLNIGGRTITVPYAMRFAANAPKLIATAIAYNPYVRTALTVASFLELAKIVWNEDSQSWEQVRPFSRGGILYSDDHGQTYSFASPMEACHSYAARQGYNNFPGWSPYLHDTGSLFACVESRFGTFLYVYQKQSLITDFKNFPVDDDFVIDELQKNPIPADLPNHLPPGIIIPVENPPVINPIVDPQADPVPRPYRVPLGEPVPVPDTNPQQWKTPVIDVIPAPLPENQWRVDIQPKDIIKLDPSPITDPQVVNQEPSGQTQQEKTPGLCDMYPDILACQKPNFDTPEIDQIQTKDASITITPDSGWGGENASCPAPRHLPGANIDFEFTTICDFMLGIRPIMIAIAWLIAGMIMMGIRQGE